MKLSASIFCGGFANIERLVQEIDSNNTDFIHVDIMDGHFVPSISAGPAYLDCVRSLTKTPLDLHFMVEDPDRMMKSFKLAQGDYVCFHYETTPHIQRCVDDIKEQGAYAGIAISPATPLCLLDEILPELDFVTVCTINPGQLGHGMISYGLDKIARLKSIINQRGLKTLVELDGASDFDNLIQTSQAGADICVLGARNAFAKGYTYTEAMAKIRSILNEA